MTVRKAMHGKVEIVYETFGSPDGEPLLLAMGIGGQMIEWREAFCRQLADRGFLVTRFDNRDAGLSTRFTAFGKTSQLAMRLRPASAAAYNLEDMADDAVAILDAEGWPSAHLVGRSLGGMVFQTMAVRHPDRVRTLTSISSTPSPGIGRPGLATLLKIVRIANPKRVKTRDDLGEYMVALQQFLGSPAYPADEAALREMGRQCYDRAGLLDTASVQRQTAAIVASGDRRESLAQVRVPTLVLHGEDDPMILPIAGRATADAIPGARLVTCPGMGHDLPAALWGTVIDEIATLAARAVA